MTWSLGLAVAVLFATAVALSWKHVLERHYLNRLDSGSVAERKDAARRLAAMHSREGLERLLAAPSLEPVVPCEVDFYTSVLVETGDSIVPLLFEALRHDEATARYRAASVLQILRPRGAMGPLVEALGREEDPNCLLSSIAHQNPDPGEAIRLLSAAMRSESTKARAGAAEALARVKLSAADLPRARRLLEQALSDPAPLVRIHGAWSLGSIGPREESVTFLENALSDEVQNVRRAAARALAALGSDARPARHALQRALEDSGSDVRKYAAEALAKIRSAETNALAPTAP